MEGVGGGKQKRNFAEEIIKANIQRNESFKVEGKRQLKILGVGGETGEVSQNHIRRDIFGFSFLWVSVHRNVSITRGM